MTDNQKLLFTFGVKIERKKKSLGKRMKEKGEDEGETEGDQGYLLLASKNSDKP